MGSRLAPGARAVIPILIALACTGLSAATTAPPLQPPSPAVATEARAIVEVMKASERGPYLRLRWYCSDGTVHPPQPYACAERGGGRQHAEYSPQRQRLAELGWPAGTILAASLAAELLAEEHRYRRLQALLLERYLVDVDDGWVLRKARYYRGRVQVEDEEQAGRDLLLQLLARPRSARPAHLLVREAVRSLPHDTGSDRTQLIRHISQEIAEKDRSFERIRIKIHTVPSAADMELVRQWVGPRRGSIDAALLASVDRLVLELSRLYGGSGEWLQAGRQVFGRHPRRGELELLLDGLLQASVWDRARRSSAALVCIRDLVGGSADAAANLVLLDLSLHLERELIRSAFEILAHEQRTRQDLLQLCRFLLDGAHGSGLLSEGERVAVAAAIDPLLGNNEATARDYVTAVQRLRRLGPWTLATVRATFAESLVSYSALEPKASRYVDDVLRGSAMLPLAEAITSLAADADHHAGITHRVFGTSYGGLIGLNPGMATGRLRLLAGYKQPGSARLDRSEIVVLPSTVSDLEPVAGILTLAEGNLLSHVQLLARNLGIPNATVSPTLSGELAAHDGKEVLLAVGPRGSVVVEELSSLPDEVRAALGERQSGPGRLQVKLEAPQPDLKVRRPLPLAELYGGLVGRVVGPKAANLGELARLFPDRVEQAIALPFGVFVDHVTAGTDPAKDRLDRAFARHRAGELDDQGLADEIERVRLAVTSLQLSPQLMGQLRPMMARLFGEPGSYGIFIRSDTNVEDLPGFTGAGLNETIPHVVDEAAQLAGIARVWASPFSPRAMAWRAPLLTHPEEVYTSVLLMKSVPADKSGVMVTTDLVNRGPGLTVAMSWGVGGAVDGDAAETLVLGADGSVQLLNEAKAPYRRRLLPTGGVEWIPTASGPVLTEQEQQALRHLAADVASRLEPERGADGSTLPWDIELGFVGGDLRLFQIRPLVERGEMVAQRVVENLLPEMARNPARPVSLLQPISVGEVPMAAIRR